MGCRHLPIGPFISFPLKGGPEQGLLKPKAQDRGLSYLGLKTRLDESRGWNPAVSVPPPNLVPGLTDPPSGASESPRREAGKFPFVS